MMPSLSTTSTNQIRVRTNGNANGNKYQRNRKIRVYVPSNNNGTNFNNYAISTDTPIEEGDQAYQERSMVTTSQQQSLPPPPPVLQAQYSLTHLLITGILLAFEILFSILLTLVLFLWNFTKYLLVYIVEKRSVKEFWVYLIATVTTTVVDSDSTSTGLPDICLNSVVLDEEEEKDEYDYCAIVLLEHTEADRIDHGIESGGSDFVQSSSNYNSSDDGGEQDAIVFTDNDEDNYNNSITNLASNSTLESLDNQQQDASSRLDSDSSCDEEDASENKENCSSSLSQDNNGNNNPVEDTETRIINKVEALFSDDNLAKDGFLLKHSRRRADGYVSLKLVANLRKVKRISKSFNVVVEALRKSQKVEINAEGTKVRRAEPLTPFLKALSIQQHGHHPQQRERDSYDSSRHNSSPNSNSLPLNPAPIQQQRPTSSCYERANNNNNPIWLQQTSRASEGNISSSLNNNFSQNRNQLKPNSSSRLNSASARPKSTSYYEDNRNRNNTNVSPVAGGMSVWLQKRKTSYRNSEGSSISSSVTVIRQPRGPDGTKGFMPGYRQAILRERKMGQQKNDLNS